MLNRDTDYARMINRLKSKGIHYDVWWDYQNDWLMISVDNKNFWFDSYSEELTFID